MRIKKSITVHLVIFIVFCIFLFHVTAHSNELELPAPEGQLSKTSCVSDLITFFCLFDTNAIGFSQKIRCILYSGTEGSELYYVVMDCKEMHISDSPPIGSELIGFFRLINLDDDSNAEVVAVSIKSKSTISIAVFDHSGRYYSRRWPRSLYVGDIGVSCMEHFFVSVLTTEFKGPKAPEIMFQLGDVFFFFDRFGEHHSMWTIKVPSKLVRSHDSGSRPGNTVPILEGESDEAINPVPDAPPNPHISCAAERMRLSCSESVTA